MRLPVFGEIEIVFDATSAGSHQRNDALLRAHGKKVIDLTPAAIGPYVVPPVNLDEHLQAPNLNMVTCGGQATVPIVAAVSAVAKVHYAEIVASIASKSAGPGTRANIDEFTQTTAKALEVLGGASRGKALIVLNPAEPPVIMRDTVSRLSEPADPAKVRDSVTAMIAQVQQYVPGYRLKQEFQFETIGAERPLHIPGLGVLRAEDLVFLEVEGAAHYLPAYAGNLDIMTSAALRTAERLVESLPGGERKERRYEQALYSGHQLAGRHARHPSSVRSPPGGGHRARAGRSRSRFRRGLARRRPLGIEFQLRLRTP